MRVVEPNQYHMDKKKRSHSFRRVALIVMILLIAGGGVGVVLKTQYKKGDDKTSANSVEVAQDYTESTREPDPQPEPVIEKPPEPKTPTLIVFADNDLKIFYDQLLQPNLEPVENPPEISGNTIADARIRKIAEDRGYRLRNSPNVALTTVDGYSLQPVVATPWQSLKSAAAAEGLQMSIVSGYRSVERQRTLFLSRLAATGATIDAVAAGTADALVNEVLITSSIPGYSKHHTGYTMDIKCAGYAFESFKNSPCNTWITANNYKVAKEHGFIPSYPPGADLQGPDPEAWEYVWVGSDLLYQ